MGKTEFIINASDNSVTIVCPKCNTKVDTILTDTENQLILCPTCFFEMNLSGVEIEKIQNKNLNRFRNKVINDIKELKVTFTNNRLTENDIEEILSEITKKLVKQPWWNFEFPNILNQFKNCAFEPTSEYYLEIVSLNKKFPFLKNIVQKYWQKYSFNSHYEEGIAFYIFSVFFASDVIKKEAKMKLRVKMKELRTERKKKR